MLTTLSAVTSAPARMFTSVEDYLTKMGSGLAEKLMLTKPLADDTTPAHPGLAQLLRQPLAAQLTTIMGVFELLKTSPFGLLCCAMGTGKSYQSLAIIFLHWLARKSPNGESWLVVCPPHLTKNWVREIFMTLPPNRVKVFLIGRMVDGGREDDENVGCREVMVVNDEVVSVAPGQNFSLQSLRNRAEFKRLTQGADEPTLCFWIGGRERMKLGPTWRPVTNSRLGWSESFRENRPRLVRLLRDLGNGRQLYWLVKRKEYGLVVPTAEGVRLFPCDRFGAPLPNRRYESAPDLDQLWTDLDFKVVNPQGKAEMEDYFKRRTVRIPRCPDSGEVLKKVCKTVKATHRYQVPHSGDLKQGVPPTFRRAALWQYQGKPLTLKPQGQLENPPRSTSLQGDGLRRWPPSEFIVRHLKHRFYGLVADEAHEFNGKESAQSQMLSRLMGVTKKFIGLTGTLSNGSASSLWALMCRLAPDRMNALGYGPALGAKGLEQFTNTYGIIEKIITREPEDGKTTKKRESIRTQEKPGIMPWLQTDQLTATGPLLAYSAFLELGDVGHLPPLEEEIVMVDPPADLLEGAAQIEDDIRVLFKDRSTWSLAKKAILQMLNILTVYTDRPYGWTPVYVDGALVTVPENLDPDRLYPKEEAYLNLIQRELRENRRVITYLHYVNFGIVERLLARLREAGIKADYMSALVAPTDRSDWFQKALKSGVQVVLCNPECVKTGLNLTEWNTIVFYQSGRNIITNCQAECRCLRIGAKRTVRLVYLAYDDTIQERTLSIMGLKKVALTAVQGRFSAEGLAGLADDITTDLLKKLIENGVTDKATEVWKRLRDLTEGERQGVSRVDRQSLLNLFALLLTDPLAPEHLPVASPPPPQPTGLWQF